ncbi:MAG: efflux RND transporter periplasmic adaptor subunit [Oligoflexia bacterium]|nr:efflux RND transporter periplasmic adaptor subunit [Oligoflexia bacterium]
MESIKNSSMSIKSTLLIKLTKICMFIMAILAIGAFVFYLLHKTSFNKKSEITYSRHIVDRVDIELTISSTGTVQPENRLELKPPIAGRVEEILVQEGENVIRGQILAWMSSTERAALLDAARTKGKQELKKWEDLYRPTPIMAPINGTIILRNLERGQTFTSADPVFVMSDKLTVKAQVDETDIAQIHLKQKAKITLDAYGDQVISGEVDKIAYEAKTVNNVTTYVIDVLPTNTPAFMRSGMTANVTFVANSKQKVIAIPNDALKQNKETKSFTVLMPGKKGEESEERDISVGISDGKYSEILGGIKEGDVILIANLNITKERPRQTTNPFLPHPRSIGGSKKRASEKINEQPRERASNSKPPTSASRIPNPLPPPP